MSEENKVVVRRALEAYSAHDWDAVLEDITPDFVMHRAEGSIDAQTYREMMDAMHSQFPDVHMTVDDVLAEDDRVAYRMTMTGTHSETGKRISMRGIAIARFVEGNVAEMWLVNDDLGQLLQS